MNAGKTVDAHCVALSCVHCSDILRQCANKADAKAAQCCTALHDYTHEPLIQVQCKPMRNGANEITVTQSFGYIE